jgi:NAD(P)H-hydrate epimerase
MKRVLPLYADLPTPAEMRQWDEAALSHFGIPPLLLMENAARAALLELKRHVTLSTATKILIFMGKGNNGGDGAALARLLCDEGCTVLVCCVEALNGMSEPAGKHAEMAAKIGVTFLPAESGSPPPLPLEWNSPHVVVDAIAGTGLRGELRPEALAFVRAVNALRDRSFVLSLDIPSGLCGLTGKAKPVAVRAHATVTFEAGKPGLFFPEAREYTGAIRVCRVGIPLAVRSDVLPGWKLLSPQKGRWPTPSPLRHKGNAGKVLIIGGSEGMAGAPVLAALGSLRAGAGLVHVLVPAGLENACRAGWPEMLTHGVGSGLSFSGKESREILDHIHAIQPDALVLGPGMGRSPAVRDIVPAVLEDATRPPALVDADALFFFHIFDEGAAEAAACEPGEKKRSRIPPLSLRLLAAQDIITPHPGEMARILPCSFFRERADRADREEEFPPPRSRADRLQQDRPAALAACLKHCAAVVVLKGAGTLIGQRGAPTVLSPFAESSLGVGGSGDVLSGIVAALLAQKFSALDATCLGVYLHGRAGELLAEKSPLGHLARDIADALLPVWKELCGR